MSDGRNDERGGEDVGAPSVDGDLVPEARGEPVGEPPVVARLMVEIRSDGSRTIARGAIEDLHSGQTVGVEARGDTPLGMAFSLARTITRGPALARTAATALRRDVETARPDAVRRASLPRRFVRRARRALRRR